MSNYFCSEAYGREKLEDTVFEHIFIVNKLFQTDAHFQELLAASKIKKMSTEDICGTNGFTSQVFRLSIVFEPKQQEQQQLGIDKRSNTYTVILKVYSEKRVEVLMQAFIGDLLHDLKKKLSIDEVLQKIGGVHNTECEFYNMFGFNQDIQSILPLPKIYFTQKIDVSNHISGLIIMEDLSHISGLLPFYKGASVEQVKEVVGCLAAFHQYTLCSPDQSWQEVFAKCIFEEKMEGFSEAMVKKLLEDNKDNIQQVLNRLSRAFEHEFMILAYRDCATQLGLPQTILHGDLWSNNLLWSKGADGLTSSKLAAFIDWQLVYKGNPMVDLSRLMVICCEPDVRRELETSIFDFYYDIFSQKMQEAGRKVEFTVQQLKKAYEFAKVCSSIGSIMLIPFFQKVQATDSDSDKNRNTSILINRAKAALEDSVEALKEVAPEWLLP